MSGAGLHYDGAGAERIRNRKLEGLCRGKRRGGAPFRGGPYCELGSWPAVRSRKRSCNTPSCEVATRLKLRVYRNTELPNQTEYRTSAFVSDRAHLCNVLAR